MDNEYFSKLIAELMVSSRIKALIPAYENIHEKVETFQPMLAKMIVIEQRLKALIDKGGEQTPEEIDDEMAELQKLADELSQDNLESMATDIAEHIESKMGMLH